MKKYNIIIVENDDDEQLFMKEGFDATGLFNIVAQVRNGDHLFQWFEEHTLQLPDVILSDLNMPGKNGYDVISGVKNNPAWLHIPVIITSTSSTKTIINKCIELGAADYLVKPETFVEYVPYVKNLYQCIEEKQLVK
ncbi:MAG: response regulator receiver protein [Flavisolibacter sp.]|jgi:CheY-like chemotaxis protein|nr:response regulator receiver protein [Flavisolibacter sp.]